jgi:pimeloyl-ACP methyl ester carboxylesterase
MGGAVRSAHVDHLVVYEPSLGLSYPAGSIDTIEDAVARGDHEAAISAVLADILGMTDEDIEPYRASPQWPARLAAAPTIPRECRVEESWRYSPGQFDEIAAPTLLLTGSLSTGDLVNATSRAAAPIPDTRIHILEGHGHLAHHTDPALVAALMQSFVADAAC